jgi:hypothetical protein
MVGDMSYTWNEMITNGFTVYHKSTYCLGYLRLKVNMHQEEEIIKCKTYFGLQYYHFYLHDVSEVYKPQPKMLEFIIMYVDGKDIKYPKYKKILWSFEKEEECQIIYSLFLLHREKRLKNKEMSLI